ncbi:MAG TPA: hypothetical protein VEK79_07750 [Thermoanaerobaculia bacterium]|nr:hypothetical protein [Thermoanaerobaculia bacterium]
MTRRIAIAAVLSLCIVSTVSAQITADSAAQRAIDVLAGPAWNDARYFAFTFNVEREGKNLASYAQAWDRFTGDYRVSGKNREGEDVRVVMNVNTKQGKAWKNGQPVADPADLLTFGYRRFINDTYWLLMGFKSFDPGVTRTYDGEKAGACGALHDVVRLSFSNVGLTPGDVYWMWVNRDTGLVDQWHMKLEGSKPEDAPSVVLFHDYRRFDGLLISTRREIQGRGQFILLDDIVVARDVPGGAFE